MDRRIQIGGSAFSQTCSASPVSHQGFLEGKVGLEPDGPKNFSPSLRHSTLIIVEQKLSPSPRIEIAGKLPHGAYHRRRALHV